MSKSLEATIVPDDDAPRQQPLTHDEAGIEVPIERLNPDTLRNLIAEFVTREWSDSGPSLHTPTDYFKRTLWNRSKNSLLRKTNSPSITASSYLMPLQDGPRRA